MFFLITDALQDINDELPYATINSCLTFLQHQENECIFLLFDKGDYKVRYFFMV